MTTRPITLAGKEIIIMFGYYVVILKPLHGKYS